MRDQALVLLIAAYLRFVGWTSRVIYVGDENLPPKPFIYVFWHSRLTFLAHTHRGRGLNVLVSTSRDGEITSSVIALFGYRLIRGTASDARTGTRSIMQIIRKIKEKKVVAITPDGPRGPAGVVKPGTAFIARAAGCPIVPVGCSVRRKKILSTWDKMMLPLPFNKGVAVSGSPVRIVKGEDNDAACERIRKALEEVTLRADGLAAEL